MVIVAAAFFFVIVVIVFSYLLRFLSIGLYTHKLIHPMFESGKFIVNAANFRRNQTLKSARRAYIYSAIDVNRLCSTVRYTFLHVHHTYEIYRVWSYRLRSTLHILHFVYIYFTGVRLNWVEIRFYPKPICWNWHIECGLAKR